jgi:hypothetical protein
MDTVPDVIASVKPLPLRDDEPRFRHCHDVAALEHYRANTFRLARRSITKVRCFQGGRPALRARFDDPYLQLTSGGWDMAFARDGVLTGDARPCPADGLRIARLQHEDLDATFLYVSPLTQRVVPLGTSHRTGVEQIVACLQFSAALNQL